jgi:protein-tyrosine kinase
MSRIHEALRRAEEDRALVQGGNVEELPPVSDSVPGFENRMSAVAAAAGPEVGPLVAQSQPDRYSSDDLDARCVKLEWTPGKHMLFFGDDPRALGTEEFRTLRSRLCQIRKRQRLQKLLISSAMPSEGKTFVAANLAQAFARQKGRRVLLIDADLRWSRLHLSLGAPLRPGLSDYLRGEMDEFQILQLGPWENLFFVPGGEKVSNPAELLANGRLKQLLLRLEGAFEWIVIDSPPAVPVADASVVAEVCDGVLLVVRAAKTSLDMALKARQEFQSKSLLGVVLNDVYAGSSYGPYYYGGYGDRVQQPEGEI